MRVQYRNSANNFAQDAETWSNLMNRFLNNATYDYSRSGGSKVSNGENVAEPRQQETLLPIDVWATPEAFHVNAYLPGINPEDVELTFEADELTIRGKLPAAPEGTEFIKRELFHGSFARKLNFNVPVDSDRIEAQFHNGLLTLSVPKAEAVKPKQIKIQAK